MGKSAPRLTKKEWAIVYACLAFVEAGEISGGPLEGETDADTDHNQDVFDSAKEKIRQRKF